MDLEQEAYFWLAETNDGITLQEEFGNTFEEVMTLNKKGDIKYFILIMPNDVHSKLVVKLGGKRKLIFFRRRMGHIAPKGQIKWTITAVGWEEKVKGVVVKSIAYVYPNGGIEWNNDEPTLADAYHQALIKQLNETKEDKLVGIQS